MNKKINLFIILTLFFTGVIFLINTFYFSSNLIENEEEKYIEETLKSSKEKNKYLDIAKYIVKSKEEKEGQNRIHYTSESPYLIKGNKEKKINKINFGFIPSSFEKKQEKNKNEINLILENKYIYSFLKNINILFYEKKGEVRGKMKNKSVKIFSPQTMAKDELIGIFIHEFSHYIDIYSLERKGVNDLSNKFYKISWNSVKVIKSGLTQKDFVSGYAMTNKYEDFAESLTYYIIHNNDFLVKSKKSRVLRRKYNFFSFYIFSDGLFKNTDFSKNNEVKDYYRDITKINFSLNNFLQYIKKSI